jgi:predicted dehydrogenase
VPQLLSDYHVMLDTVRCDAVIITSANADHCAIALECVRRRKHILCEKPIATTVEDAQAMIWAAREAGVKLMTAFPVRFSPAVRQAKRIIKEGKLGRVLGGATSNHGSMPGGWFTQPERSGGGAIIDHTVHVIDLIRWLFEDEIESVFALAENRLHPEISCEDCGLLLFRTRKGLSFSLDTSWSRCKSYPIWGDVKLDIRGEDANLFLNCFPCSVNLYDDTVLRHTAFSLGDNLDRLMLEEFCAAIREDREPEVTGEDGLRALEVTLAAYKASSGGHVVKLSHCPV